MERKKEVVFKSFLYFHSNFFLGTFFYNPDLCFISGTLNLFLYAFKLFHQIFFHCVFLTWNHDFLPAY